MLRPYQQKLVTDVLRALLEKEATRVLAVLPTGGGKTVVFADIADAFRKASKRVLILAHRIELIDQTSRKLTSIGCEHALFTASRKDLSAVTVASVPTLDRAKSHGGLEPDLIIVDEAHHVLSSNSWGRVIERFPAARVLGFTATPCRGDGRGLGESFDVMIEGPTIKELTDMGFLAKAKTFVPKTRLDLSNVRTVAGDYNQSQLTTALEKGQIEWQAGREYVERANGLPAIAFCVNLMHCAQVHRAFTAGGVSSALIDGTMTADERANLLGAFARGEIKVLISCNVIAEGTDVPEATVALMLRPTKSKSLWLQMIGRVLRPLPTKPFALVLDLAAGSLEHGLCDDPQEWSLTSKARSTKNKNTVPSNAVCEQCFIAYPRKGNETCPNCGCTPKVRELPKTLRSSLETAEVTSEEIARIRESKKREVSKARTLEDLLRIERERGYKRGWAIAIHHSRRGRASA